MDVAGELQEVRLLLHHNGPVAILKQMAVPLVPPLEGPRVAGEHPTHYAGTLKPARVQEQVEMVWQEGS